MRRFTASRPWISCSTKDLKRVPTSGTKKSQLTHTHKEDSMLGVVVRIWEKETDMTSQPGLHSSTVSKEKPGVGTGSGGGGGREEHEASPFGYCIPWGLKKKSVNLN